MKRNLILLSFVILANSVAVFAADPITTAIGVIGPWSVEDVYNRTIQGQSTNSGFLVTITDDGLQDDSVSAYQSLVVLTSPDMGKTFKVVSKDTTWKCQAGRGHQDFSKITCE